MSLATACAEVREEISADLDGESDASGRALIDAHVAGCPGCRDWLEAAVVVTRTVRTGPAEPGPDLVALVLPTAPRTRVAPRAARVALAGVGAVQTVLGVLALTGTDGHGGGAMLGADMAHLGHETGAWNVAVGVAFIAGARWTRQLAGLLPVLGTFVLVLGVLSAIDLLAGRVEPGRVLAHGLVVVGIVLAAYVRWAGPSPTPEPAPARTPRPEPGTGTRQDRRSEAA